MKLTEEQVSDLRSKHGWAKETIRAIEAEVLRLNGVGEGDAKYERSYACDHDDAVHCSNCYAVTPQQAAPIQERCQHGVRRENRCPTCDSAPRAQETGA